MKSYCSLSILLVTLSSYYLRCSGDNRSFSNLLIDRLSWWNLRSILFLGAMKVSPIITSLSIGETRHISMLFKGLNDYLDDYCFWSISNRESSRMFGFSLLRIWTIGGYLYSIVSFLTFSNYFSPMKYCNSFSNFYLPSIYILLLPIYGERPTECLVVVNRLRGETTK